MPDAILEIYASIECPYAYLAVYRLKQLWPEIKEHWSIRWKALSLEYINRQSYSKPLYEAEYQLFQKIEPGLPWQLWERPDWEWPSTFWPAFEALACAQAQGPKPAFEMSWALRYAHFTGARNLSWRHDLLGIAGELANQGQLDYDRFEEDWDSGRYKKSVVDESRHGWGALKLDGSATFILPGGRRVTNPAIGEIDFDENAGRLNSFVPYPGDPFDAYRKLLA
jgi:predicted DsbA family dithiol-disulfide isomerase